MLSAPLTTSLLPGMGCSQSYFPIPLNPVTSATHIVCVLVFLRLREKGLKQQVKDHHDWLRDCGRKEKVFFSPFALGPTYNVASLSGPETGQVPGNSPHCQGLAAEVFL